MIRKTLNTVILTLFSFCLFGQTNNELVKMGDAAMINGQYTNAVYYYAFILYKVKQGEEAHYYPYEITTTYKKPKKDENNSLVPPSSPSQKEKELIHKLAKAYLMADDYSNAEVWFKAATEHPDKNFPNSRYYYSESLMYNQHFEKALDEFSLFQEEIDNSENKFYKLSDSKISSCQFALNSENKDTSIEIVEINPLLNTGTSNFGMRYITGNKVIFSSARSSTNPLSDSINTDTEKYLLDIYIAPYNSNDGSVGTPEKFTSIVNSREYHEGSAILSSDGNTIFFTRMNPQNKNETKIYSSRKINGQWIEPQEMDAHVNMEGFRSLTPFLSEDNKKLYFSSNRPGGEGGLDLWSVKITENGQTGRPVNLGNSVNSVGDETAPFFHIKSSRLYYSSTGHIGFGGQDIFFNLWNSNTESYGIPTNVGSPINSSADESYYILDDLFENGFITSNRSQCSECDSIYSLKVHCDKLYRLKSPELLFTINGYVYDKKTNEPLANSKVEFKDVSYKWGHFEIFTDENGFYEKNLIPELELFMRASKKDYFADKAIISTIGYTASKTLHQDFYLEKIPTTEITIEGIEYDFDKATLRPESEIILDNLIEFLELNDNLTIEIRSHTDQRGGDNYNLSLSERRAQSVVDYLVLNGIPIERLKPKGYGETLPAEITDEDGNTNAMTIEYIANLPKEKRKEAHQRNRRTAFFVLKQD